MATFRNAEKFSWCLGLLLVLGFLPFQNRLMAQDEADMPEPVGEPEPPPPPPEEPVDSDVSGDLSTPVPPPPAGKPEAVDDEGSSSGVPPRVDHDPVETYDAPAVTTPAEMKKEEEDNEDPFDVPAKTTLRKRGQPASGRSISDFYRIALGVAKPTFTDLEKYEDFYGQTAIMPSIQVDYYFFDWFTALGVAFRMNFYKDKGHAVVGSDLEADKEGKTELTLIPLQAALAVQMTPFAGKWVVVSGWFGAEATYFQEIRDEEDSDADEASAETTDEESSDSDSKPFVSKGWKRATVLGVSANFLMNALEDQSVRSLSTIGIGKVYFSPYLEIAKSMQKKGLTFSRTAMGLAFTFETF